MIEPSGIEVAGARSSGRLLVVDDLEDNRDMIRRWLTRKGYQVETAADGKSALEAVAGGAFDLVLLDIMMPGISGLETLECLRADWGRPALPVIMVSARGESEDVVRALEIGANDYITKPIDFPIAIARIETHLALKHADQALRESQERFALAMEGATVTVTPDGRIDSYSAAAKAIFGYDATDVIGGGLDRLLILDDGTDSSPAAVLRLLEGLEDRDLRIETQGRSATGDRIPLEISALRFWSDRRWLTLVCLRDITSKKSAERTIGRVQEYLTSAIASMTEGFVIWSQEDRILLCNDRFRAIEEPAGLQIRVGLSFTELVEAQARSGHWAAAAVDSAAWSRDRHDRHRGPGEEYLDLLSDGRTVRVSESALGNGQTIGLVTDITKEVNHAKSLRLARDQAEAASRAKSEFLATMSHELRTPLNAIIGFSELMHLESLGPIGCDDYKSYAEDINESGRYLLSIINDVLDISRFEANPDLNETRVDLRSILDACRSGFALEAEKAGITLNFGPAGAPLVVRADARLIKQAISNVLSNALKFSERGGEVLVCAGLTEEGGVFVRVTDTGVGIAADELSRVMEPFYQIDGSLARANEGTGLGLSLAKRFVEFHQGAIELESEPGAGTGVTLYLPKTRHLALGREWPPIARAADSKPARG